MALKTFKPYTKSTRGTILVDRAGLWKGKPHKTFETIYGNGLFSFGKFDRIWMETTQYVKKTCK